MDWGSVFNSFVNFMLWFLGCMHVIGCLGGFAFFVLIIYLGFRKPRKLEELFHD